MKSFVVTLALSTVGLVVPYSSDAASAITGYLDPSTGAFAAISPRAIKAAATSSVARTGTVKVVVTLTIESAIGTDEPITCTAGIAADDASFENSATTSNVLIRSGTTGTVTLEIPYDWTMAAAGESATASVSCTEGVFGGGGVSHSVFFTVGTFVVPATANSVTTLTRTASM